MKDSTKKIVLTALYIALFIILSIYATINFQGLKITIQNLPIYVAAITLGAIPGAIVGFAGMLVNQIITYGFTATTLFWVLPQTILGAVCGYIFENNIVKMKHTHRFWATIIILQILVTILNTVVYAIDAIIFSYYNYLVIFGPIILRLMASILTGIVYCVVIPLIVDIVKKIH